MIVKPFKGPAPLGPNDHIYGRRDDIEALIDILLSDRIVLLCSASGAGKTSLLEAGLNKTSNASGSNDKKEDGSIIQNLGCMARMRLRGFQILPKIRVDTPLPKNLSGSAVPNRFAFSMLNSLEQACTGETIPPKDLAALDLNFYFEERTILKNTSSPKLMVFDQFEELIHKDRSGIGAKKLFLHQLGRILENQLYWAIFAMRSEYVTEFDEYLDLIPTGLSSRFTLQLLSEKGAYDAITKPLLEPGSSTQVSIGEKAALKLVSELSGEKGALIKSMQELSTQPKIEPLHLQVVCDSLWSQAVKMGQNITVDTIKKSGGVDEALEGYFNDQLRKSCQLIASLRNNGTLSEIHIERMIRKWIETSLISSQKTRNSIYEDDERILKLNVILPIDTILSILCDTYLIRRDVRNQRNLYEIAHDRLVELIIKNNSNWFKENLTPLQQRAEKWDTEKNDKLLILGKELKEAKKWVKRQPAQETELESKFIDAAIDLERKTKTQKIIKSVLAGSAAVILILVTVFAIIAHSQNENLAKKGEQSKLLLMANSRMQSWFEADPAALDLLTLLTYQKLQTYKKMYKWQGSGIEKKIRETVEHNIRLTFTTKTFTPYLRQVFFPDIDGSGHPKDRAISFVAVHPTTNKIALCDSHNIVKIYGYGPKSTETGTPLEINPRGKPIISMSFQPGSPLLSIVTSDEIRFYNCNTGELTHSVPTIELAKQEPVFSSDGRYFATVTADGSILLWDTDQWSRRELKGTASFITSEDNLVIMAFSRDGKLIAVGDSTGSLNAWRTENTEQVYWKKPSDIVGQDGSKGRESKLVGIGFDPDSGGLVTISSDYEKINLWLLPHRPDESVRLVLDDNAIERAERIGSFRRLLRSIQTENAGAYVDSWLNQTTPKHEAQNVKAMVVACAFDRGSDQLHFAIGLDNGFAFIIRKRNTATSESFNPSSLNMDTEYMRFPRDITKLVFANPISFGNAYQYKKITGITHRGDVFIVDDVPRNVRKEMADKASVSGTSSNPDSLAEYVCGNAWRNLTQEEWDIYMPDEPYRCVCPAFAPGFGTGYTICPN